MSVGKGKTQHNILLSDAMSQQLATLAEKAEFHGRKNEVIEHALVRLFEGDVSATVLLSVHDHLSQLQATLTATLQALDVRLTQVVDKLSTLYTAHTHMVARLQHFEEDLERKHRNLLQAYDALKDQTNKKPGLVSAWLKG